MNFNLSSLLFLCVAFSLAQLNDAKSTAVLFDAETASRNNVSLRDLQTAFDKAYTYFQRHFDYSAYNRSLHAFNESLIQYQSREATRFELRYSSPHCDLGAPNSASKLQAVTNISPFPGGSLKQIFGFDFSKSLFDLSAAVQTPASTGLISGLVLSKTGIALGAGLMQSVVAAMVHIVPPLIPPPVWNNQPLPCAPMVTGHNCFGAVLYPITMADFVIADVTDAMLDGVIDGFPNTYATKVGKTSDAMYKACFGSYMSMQCSSIFPRCTAPQSRDEPIAVGGRVPMCFHLCILPLVMCPGFWFDDIAGVCGTVSVPPLCTQANYFNVFKAPPQYSSFDEAHPFERACPNPDYSSLDASEDPTLYDVSDAQGNTELAKLETGSEASLAPKVKL